MPDTSELIREILLSSNDWSILERISGLGWAGFGRNLLSKVLGTYDVKSLSNFLRFSVFTIGLIFVI